ncbi:hypothetical protein JEQ12_016220 [Ovis aries]|uniref:Uncharacterized protein n=1 Tax=Ovis aries TaxID=9940 RepID=A0A836A503_SHEEP|nr:hypothetical protein JEQ12_016220 [Ovis aries]
MGSRTSGTGTYGTQRNRTPTTEGASPEVEDSEDRGQRKVEERSTQRFWAPLPLARFPPCPGSGRCAGQGSWVRGAAGETRKADPGAALDRLVDQAVVPTW